MRGYDEWFRPCVNPLWAWMGFVPTAQAFGKRLPKPMRAPGQAVWRTVDANHERPLAERVTGIDSVSLSRSGAYLQIKIFRFVMRRNGVV